MSSNEKRTILITGCSPGGMGAALAIDFHNAGHHVFATARNPSKLAPLAAQGINILTLDVTSTSSITSAVEAVTSSLPQGKGLDMLVNNAAGNYTMPIVDAALDAAKELFDINVWSQIAVTQAFLPLLLKSTTSTSTAGELPQTMIVNHTSVGAVIALPFQGIYNASKAAFAMLTDTMRYELAPFNIRVIDLKTGLVISNLISNSNANTKSDRLPQGSIYEPAREVVEKAMSQEAVSNQGTTAEQWASEVATILLGRNPPNTIWKGQSASLIRVASCLPAGLFDGQLKKMTKMDVVERIIEESRKQSS